MRAQLTRQAEEHATSVFAANLRNLLLQPPLRGIRVLGIDPGYRTGCKIAVVDEMGNPVESTTIYPHAPSNRWQQAKDVLKALAARHDIRVLAIGNGTASRETEQLAAEIIGELEQSGNRSLGYVMVNEAGASVYSASEVARRISRSGCHRARYYLDRPPVAGSARRVGEDRPQGRRSRIVPARCRPDRAWENWIVSSPPASISPVSTSTWHQCSCCGMSPALPAVLPKTS